MFDRPSDSPKGAPRRGPCPIDHPPRTGSCRTTDERWSSRASPLFRTRGTESNGGSPGCYFRI